MIEALFLGEAGGPRLLEADVGSHDDGIPFYGRLETVPAGPGVAGEAIFTALFVGIESDCAATVDVTPIISGTEEDGQPYERELETQQIIIAKTATRMDVLKQLGLSDPLYINGVEVGRWAPRANWFRTRIVALVHGEGDLIFHGLGVEMEVVRESIPTQTPAPVPAGS